MKIVSPTCLKIFFSSGLSFAETTVVRDVQGKILEKRIKRETGGRK